MKALIFLIFISTAATAQTTGEFKYQYKEEAFPYDSGVSVSDKQYQFLLRQQLYNGISDKTKTEPPKVIIQTKEVRRKGDGSKWKWGLGGLLLGSLAAFFATR